MATTTPTATEARPSLGRIVIYHFSAARAKKYNGGAGEAPAIICAANVAGGHVALRVLCNGSAVLIEPQCWHGTEPGQWSWPERAR